ncbi:hypothetical protein V1318_20070 [Lysobacter sp. CCNWLW3]|uniref:hypothetical protein n=1 Tax=unclassified Lysobacter TaxID=2635362 RepID=UPI002FD1BC97
MDAETLKILIAVVGASVSFCWGVWTWRSARRDQWQAQQREGERLSEARRIEATRPFLEKQLELYAEAARVCARIASGHGGTDAVARFWELYWGELALVENRQVEAKMVRFGQALEYMPEDRSELRQRALELAAACRASLARSWGVDAWVAPDLASERAERPQRA